MHFLDNLEEKKSKEYLNFFLLLWHLCTVLVYFSVPSFENVINNSLLPFKKKKKKKDYSKSKE